MMYGYGKIIAGLDRPCKRERSIKLTGRLQEKKGYYYVLISYKNEAGEYKRKWMPTGLPVKNNKRKAEKMLPELVMRFEEELEQKHVVVETLGMPRLLDEYLRIKKTTVRANSYETYRMTVDTQIKPYFEKLNVSVQQLQAAHIQAYYTTKAEQGIKAATLEKHRTIIRGALEYAVNTLQIIEQNPADRTTLPRKEKRVPKFYTEQQLKALFQAVKDEAIETPVRISGTYGLRRGETLGLMWSAVDWERKTLTVQHSIVRCGKEHLADDLVKSGSSYRTLPLTKDMEKYLKRLQKHQQEMKKACGNGYHDNDYICKWDDGTPLRPDYVTNRFREFLKSRKFKPVIRFHDLRHSSASLLINMGFSLKEVQEWLGHANIASTNIYSHLLYKSKENMAEKVNEALSLG